MKKRMKFLFLLLLTFCSFIENSFAQSAFKATLDEKKVATIFNNYKNIDSLSIAFFRNQPIRLYISEPKNKLSKHNGNNELTMYYLNFEGDQFWLKRKYSLLYDFVFQQELISKIVYSDYEREFGLVLTHNGSKIIDGPNYSSASYPGARLNSTRKEDFIRLLNQNFTTKKVPAADSILIIQFATTRDGTLTQHEILYGHKASSLYENFLKTYAEFNSTLPKERYPATKGLVLPKMQNGERVGLIDIFIRLNPDRTFTVSAQGNDRDLKIKEFKNDPDNPLFL